MIRNSATAPQSLGNSRRSWRPGVLPSASSTSGTPTPGTWPRPTYTCSARRAAWGKPKGNARRFLRKVSLEPGTRYAILTTQGAPRPDKKTGKLPTQEEQDRWERVIPIMNELLEAKGLTKVAEGAVLVTGMKGPLEEGWQNKVAAFADKIMSTAQTQPGY